MEHSLRIIYKELTCIRRNEDGRYYPTSKTKKITHNDDKNFLEQETADMLYDALLDGLLLDDNHPRRSQPAADTLQRVCAEALQELALSAEGEAALKGNTRAMDALRKLKHKGLTPAARQCAASTTINVRW